MIKEVIICLALMDMNGVTNQENICENTEHIKAASEMYDIDSTLYVSLLWEETRFNSGIKSYNGRACGISQVIPKWTSEYVRYKTRKQRKIESKRVCTHYNTNIPSAIYEGARILSLYKKFYKKTRYYLCGYNKGYRCDSKEKNKSILQSGLSYAERILRFQKRLKRHIRKKQRELKY